MTAPLTNLVHLEVAERAALAGKYAEAAAALAAAGDTVGMVRALGCAGRAILAATDAAQTLRPSNERGRA